MKLRLVGCATYLYKSYHFERGQGDLAPMNADDREYLLEQVMQDGITKVFKEVADDAPVPVPPREANEDSPLENRREPASDRVKAPPMRTITKGPKMVVDTTPDEEVDTDPMKLDGSGVKV